MNTIESRAIAPEAVKLDALKLDALERFATHIAAIASKGDVIFLEGELGAGKSTVARAIIRAIAGDDELEVPSPTFPLMIPYDTPRLDIAHYDLYRLGDPSEAEELGLYDDMETRLTLIEWPDDTARAAMPNRLQLRLDEAEGGTSRTLTMQGFGTLADKLSRLTAMQRFLNDNSWGHAGWAFLQGDASSRSYIRLFQNGEQRLLMNAPPQPDGPPVRDGKPYSQIAHLAEDMTSFVAVSDALRAHGLRAPKVEAHDLAQGLLLVSDFGDDQYYTEITEQAADHRTLYEDGIDVLVSLRSATPAPMPVNGSTYHLPAYDQTALGIEADLVIDWHWPHQKGQPISEADRAAYHAIWQQLFPHLARHNKNWVLRDFHSPNMMRLPGATACERVGIIDFQDALIGHAAYDVVSLCQDARLTVPRELEQQLLTRYIERAQQADPAMDVEDFKTAYAILGAQRCCKLLGIFIRLAVRDGKTHYLAHIPRIWDYLERNLAHPALAQLKAWYDENFPPESRAAAAPPPRQQAATDQQNFPAQRDQL